jgi:hypothetical protein
MRALTTIAAVLPAPHQLPAIRIKLPAIGRASAWGKLFRRRPKPTLFHRCLAVHMATAGTLSALR